MSADLPSPKRRHARGGSLRNRLIVLVLLALVPAAALLAFTGLEERRSAAERVRSETDRLAGLAAAGHDHLIAGTRDLLVALAAAPSVGALDGEACSGFLSRLLPQYPQYANLAAALPTGDVFCSAVPPTSPVNVADRAYFRLATRTGSFSVGEYQVGRVTHRPSINFGWPVLDAEGDVRVVVIAALDLSALQDVTSGVSLPRGSSVSMTDRNGTILARQPDPERWVGQHAPDAPEESSTEGRDPGPQQLRGVDGAERLYAFVPLQSAGADLVLRVGIPTDVAFAEVTGRLARDLAGLGVVALLAVGAAWSMGDLLVVRRARRLAAVADRVAGGDLSARSGARPGGGDEVDAVGRAFDRMAEALEARQAEAERSAEELQRSQAELRRNLEELQAVDRQRQELLSHMVTAQEAERARVAADIHDDSIQVMTAVGLRLERLRRRLTDAGQLRLLQELQGTVGKAIERLRHLLFQLHPPALDRDGLAAAIKLYSKEAFEGSNCTFDVVELFEKEPPDGTRLLLYRIAQEALNNVRKHGRASHVDVALEPMDEGYRVSISDNGRGFSPDGLDRPAPGHLGMAAMRERAEQNGGWWRVHSRPGHGTTIEFWLPGSSGTASTGEARPQESGVAP